MRQFKSINHSPLTIHRSGQALIILLLVMVVALTVGLSIASRSLTDVKISTQTEESQKAFSAAEAGVEEILRQDLATLAGGGGVSSNIGTDAAYSVQITAQGGAQSYVPNRVVSQDDIAQINLTDGGLDGKQISVYWAKTSDPSESADPNCASMEISFVYNSGGLQLSKFGFDPGTCGRRTSGFSTATESSFTIGSDSYKERAQVVVPTGAQIMRLRPLYNKASLAVEAPAGFTFPTQSYLVASTGTSGEATRKIEVTRSLEAMPPIFDYVLYSGSSGGIQK